MPPAFSFRSRAAISASVLAACLSLLLTGCVVKVDKNNQGSQKKDNVSVVTPFGGVHVQTNQLSAADLGMPVYPGATLATGSGNDHDKSANIDMGFGPWQMRLKVVHYTTPDSQDKVAAFYRKALGQFGTVIACNGDSADGTPSRTDQGLTCNEHDHHGNVNVNVQGYQPGQGFNLRAGSVHHQHIVAFDDSNGGTKFTIVEMVLPEHTNQHGTPD